MAHRGDNRAASGTKAGARGKLMIFGRPTLMWDGAPTAEEYFKTFGYDEVHTLDFSDYENATFVHNLNSSELPEGLEEQYDAVSMGGTIEHVFHVGNALCTAARLLRIGGTVTCSAPANNWLDHGFYQLCPTLKFDFFQSNNFDLGQSVATLYRPMDNRFRRVVPVYPGESHLLNYIPARIAHTLFATRTVKSSCETVPIQTVYRNKINKEAIRWRFKPFEPYDMEGSRRIPTPMCTFPLVNPKPRNGCWAFPFRMEEHPASPPARPFRSTALVYENGKLLKWIVSSIDMVSERPASYIHSGACIHLSTADGSDPRDNGKVYTLAFPQPYAGLEPYAEHSSYTRPVGEPSTKMPRSASELMIID